jgi:putative hydrolase of the HAD superfamily
MHYTAAVFFDIGGVLLTNGWDTAARERASKEFGLDAHDFHTRHGMVKTAFETGRMTLHQYLQRTIFYRPRTFTPDAVKQFMFEQSQELPGAIAFVRTLAKKEAYRLCALNNESLELNEHRIHRFKLDEIFLDFFSSCYLQMVKPDEDIYRTVLAITRIGRDQAIFVDDRPVNVEAALAAGYRALLYENLEQLRAALAELGIAA